MAFSGVYYNIPFLCLILLLAVFFLFLAVTLSKDLSILFIFSINQVSFHLFFFFWWDWRLNSGLSTCKADALQLEPHFQSILLWLF
jgi:heme/copper-type cytochrome/quinol oxidase subunit 4